MACKSNGGCDMKMCKIHDGMYKAEELSDEDISKNYQSDDEHVDKWNNFEKACWSGYKQVGMKNKGGKNVPNCVPINKATGLPEETPTSWNGIFKPKVD
jgi:hypothetical protein